MMLWAQTSQQIRLAWLLVLFLILCGQLFVLLRSVEHRKGRYWRGTALWCAVLLAALLVLYDLPQRIALPVWSVGVTVLLAAAVVVLSFCFSTRHSRRRITRASGQTDVL